jgi:hypothetical protein
MQMQQQLRVCLVGLALSGALSGAASEELPHEDLARVLDCVVLRDLGLKRPEVAAGSLRYSTLLTQQENKKLARSAYIAFWKGRTGTLYLTHIYSDSSGSHVSLSNVAMFSEPEGRLSIDDYAIGGLATYQELARALEILDKRERDSSLLKDLRKTDAICHSAIYPDGIRPRNK